VIAISHGSERKRFDLRQLVEQVIKKAKLTIADGTRAGVKSFDKAQCRMRDPI
jgi:hypothetical protein